MSSREGLADLAREGYLPIDINPRDGVVTLTKLTHADFQEVWFSETVARADAESHKEIPFSVFIEQYADRQAGTHLRLIGHTSRCGSTLLANLLSLRPSTIVLKEPDFVTKTAQKIVQAAGPAESRTCHDLMAALLNFSSHAAAASGRELVIKLTSWTVPVVISGLGASENTTWLFMWREPEKVVASNMATPPSWGHDTEQGRAVRDFLDVADTGTVEFYANVWHRVVASFMSTEGGQRWRILKYQELANDKAASFMAVESWFNLVFKDELPSQFEKECRRYSKGSQVETFEPGKAHLRTPLETAEERVVSVITKRALKALYEETAHRLLS